jgi:hypothetical protein
VPEAHPSLAVPRDERVLRIVAAFVAVISLVAMVLGPPAAPWILVLLAVDFAVRGFGRSASGPLWALGSIIVGSLGLQPTLLDPAPKRFAARVGIVIALAAAGLYFLGFMVAATATTGALVICAALESAFAVCVPSKVHARLPDELASVLAR